LALAQVKSAKATMTTDLSSTDDAQYKSKKMYYSTKRKNNDKQHTMIVAKESSYTRPPKYNGNIILKSSCSLF